MTTTTSSTPATRLEAPRGWVSCDVDASRLYDADAAFPEHGEQVCCKPSNSPEGLENPGRTLRSDTPESLVTMLSGIDSPEYCMAIHGSRARTTPDQAATFRGRANRDHTRPPTTTGPDDSESGTKVSHRRQAHNTGCGIQDSPQQPMPITTLLCEGCSHTANPTASHPDNRAQLQRGQMRAPKSASAPPPLRNRYSVAILKDFRQVHGENHTAGQPVRRAAPPHFENESSHSTTKKS